MTSSMQAAISLKVTARLDKGEQVMACGDAPFLGSGDPERALPLHTTPADYPLWFSKDLPEPPKNSTRYRYCIFRAGRFHRWETVRESRIMRLHRTPQVASDVLDEEPRPNQDGSGASQGRSESSGHVTCLAPRSQHTQQQDQREHLVQGEDHEGQQHEVIESPRPVSLPSDVRRENNSEDNGGSYQALDSDEAENLRVGAGVSAAATTPLDEARGRGAERRPLAAPTAAAAGGLTSTAAIASNVDTPIVTLAHGKPSRTSVEEEPKTVDGLQSLQVVAEAASRIQWHQQHRLGGASADGMPGEAITLRRPPSLEAEEGDGGGLGLGFRLGVEAMTSPPPKLKKTARLPAQTWSQRAGGVVVASFFLPLKLSKRIIDNSQAAGPSEWTAEWDYEHLVAQQSKLRVVRVGTVKSDEPITEEDKAAVVKALWKLHCVPVFLSDALAHKCYYKYCKGVLWPVMHDVVGVYGDGADSLLDDKAITDGWHAYKQVNRAFRDKVVEVFHEGDMIWVHGFHLALLPSFLDRTVKVARIGLFLHTPFPPGEIFRAIPQRTELLRGMLGADQVGFHRYLDSRHFLSSCRRHLGLHHIHSTETGLVQISHGGKPVIVTNRHAGVDPRAVRASLETLESEAEVKRMRTLHEDRLVIGGLESVEKMKGVWLKLLAFENMLQRHPELVGRVSMHEIGISTPVRGSDYRACQEQLSELVGRLNSEYGQGTIHYEERDMADAPLTTRVALMSVASVFVKTPVHDSLSTTPVEYRIVQQTKRERAKDGIDKSRSGWSPAGPGVLILSEAVSCLSALRGSVEVNPWKVEAVSEAMAGAITATKEQRAACHEADIDWCELNTTAAWAEDVLGVLSTVPKEKRNRYATTGLGLTSRVVGTDPTFKRLDTNMARRAYKTSKSRVFFLDYGGTLVKDVYNTGGFDMNANAFEHGAKKLSPGRSVVEGLQGLCSDPSNVVFVVSGRGKDELEHAFGHIKGLGLAAEHGSLFRWPCPNTPPPSQKTSATSSKAALNRADTVASGGTEAASAASTTSHGPSPRDDQGEWEALHPGLMDTAWKNVVRRFMKDFQIHTHGSYLEEKGTALLWHYGDADPEFGAMQAKQLQDELSDVLCSSSFAGSAADGHAWGTGTCPMGLECSETSALSGSSRASSASSDRVCAGMDIIHEEGRNSEAGGGGAYLEVRARGASKGNFVHMVLTKLGWRAEDSRFGVAPPDGIGVDHGATGVSEATPNRFCLCVGDDASDEDMFLAVKSYAQEGMSVSTRSRGAGAADAVIPSGCLGCASGETNTLPERESARGTSRACLLTVTVGGKPSDADAWLPGVDAVVSLLRTLGRVPSRRDTAQLQLPGLSLQGASPLAAEMGAVSDTRGGHSVSPVRSFRASSSGDTAAVQENPGRGFRRDAGEPPFTAGPSALNVGSGVPVVRRHSYSVGGKPRISLSLGEFLRVVAQPEPEPLMF